MDIDWTKVGQGVRDGLIALSPYVSAAAPEAKPIIDVIAALLKAEAAAEPVAVELMEQIRSGATPTPAQLQAAIASYHAADDALAQSIADHIAAANAKP